MTPFCFDLKPRRKVDEVLEYCASDVMGLRALVTSGRPLAYPVKKWVHSVVSTGEWRMPPCRGENGRNPV